MKQQDRKTLPPLLSGIPAHLCRAPAPPLRRKRHRPRGKRSSWLVRMKACLVSTSTASWTEYGAVPRLFISRHSLDPVDAWLVPVVGPDEVFQPRGPCSPRPRWRGVNLRNLRPLCVAPRTANAVDPPAPARIGLVNARSLANKTFILKDFLTSRGLDFLCVTETWLTVVEHATAVFRVLPLLFPSSTAPPKKLGASREALFHVLTTSEDPYCLLRQRPLSCPFVLLSEDNCMIAVGSTPVTTFDREDLCEGLLYIMAYYYAFHLTYPKCISTLLSVLQTEILQDSIHDQDLAPSYKKALAEWKSFIG
ncbi:uncharacterized protein LOC126388390 isoform X1 [Epinephelus moara]|uniref:uncharacterized protein LOC126388390 isoform X1 n=1 Tax=Epinephelus moara TaxID=300413 RepID=UPI00214ECE86|nr:uncharacterized protein LOC126388390 isoform X1 [Epinephelus moara]